MKKLVSLLISFILLLSIFPTALADEYMTVYAPDGRAEWIRVTDFNSWHAVGWYSEPVMYVYALDGRSQYIPKNEFFQWQSAGWYSAPVMYMYAPDGRVQLILKSELSKWQKSGWYTKPVITIYSGGKSKIVPKEEVSDWFRSGWFTYVKLYNEYGDFISVASPNVWDYLPEWKWQRSSSDSDYYITENVPLYEIEWCPNGTNISLEQAKKIAREYVVKNFGYSPNIGLESYSDTSYLLSAGYWDGCGSELISVNKTTGYAFYVGGGNAGYMPNIMNPF